MTIKHIFFAALTAVLAASCTNDDSANGTDNGQNAGKVKVTLTASTPETRVGMTKTSNSAASLYWQSGDNILVQTITGSSYGSTKMTTADDTETGSKSATFTGEVETGTEIGTYAVYPYNEKHNFTSATALTYNLPSTYTYSTVESQIFSKTADEETTYPSNSTNLPMLGTISNNKVTFKMLGGMAVIRIDSMPATSGTITVTADQKLCGDFSVDMSASEAVITSPSTTATDNNSVTFTFSSATTGSAGVFYLPLATGSYSNLTVAVTCNNATQTINYDTLSIKRCDVKLISLTTNGDGKLMHIESLGNNRYKINGYVFVDLGLPSKTLWAETNVGATLPADYGNYYAWGETTTKDDYTWSTYKWTETTDGSSCTKYASAGGTLEASDDAATVVWGTTFRTPTKEELEEFATKCSFVSANQTNSKGETVSGYTFTSTITGHTGNSVFLPSAGCYYGTELKMSGSAALYWTNTVWSNVSQASMLFFTSNDKKVYYYGRCYGFPIRPVTKLPSSAK